MISQNFCNEKYVSRKLISMFLLIKKIKISSQFVFTKYECGLVSTLQQV